MSSGAQQSRRNQSPDPIAHTACKNVSFTVPVKLKKPVALIGLPGVGKSVIAEAFGNQYGVPVHDTDQLIESTARCTIADLFARHSEVTFRHLEHVTIAAVLQQQPPALLALGGGAFVQPDTRALLQDVALTVWLKTSLGTALHRIRSKPGTRPLLATPDPDVALQQLADSRTPLYAAAHVHLDLEGAGIVTAMELLYHALYCHDVLA
jgi:shikimate kinase